MLDVLAGAERLLPFAYLLAAILHTSKSKAIVSKIQLQISTLCSAHGWVDLANWRRACIAKISFAKEIASIVV